jgi:nucleoid-associated protein YgaU
MAVTPFKALLFFLGGCTAAAATAYVSDVFDPYLGPPAAVVSLPEPASGADLRPSSLPVPEPTTAATPPPSPEILPPSFDVVRVEGDGSFVIAGKAAPSAKVEIVTGARVIGRTIAGLDGDFAIVADEPLQPGGYQLALRSTTLHNVIATSLETAVVSIPQTKSGQVLVLIEQPGEGSKLVTMPEMASSGPAEALADKFRAAVSPASGKRSAEATTAESKVMVEAVEIEGRKIFLAGVADPGRKVRAYVDDVPLGEAKASPDGRFLIEAEFEISVGDHVIHVEVLEPDGIKVMAKAMVPFEREPGAAIAAVAPAAPDAVASTPLPSDAIGQLAAASERLALKLENVENAVIIRRGDTLWRISHRVYGQGVRYSTIYLANETQISDPNQIWPGQVFKVPERTPEGEPANMRAVGEQATTTSMQ